MNKTALFSTIGGVVVIIAVVIVAAKYNAATNPSLNNTDQPQEQSQQTSEQVQIEEIQQGDGPEAQVGSEITVRYTGTLADGTVFDTTGDGEPRTFTLNQGSLIEGWIQGIPGMKVGGKRKLTIPPSLGYGAMEQNNIPANSTLIFEIELVDVQ